MQTERTSKPWDVSTHDTIPPVDFWLKAAENHVYLFSFLLSEGSSFRPPYDDVRQRIQEIIDDQKARQRPAAQVPKSEVSPQRIRTWRSVFETFGLFTVDQESKLRLTPFGRAVKFLATQVTDKVEGANDHLAKLAVEVLGRHLLSNPIDSATYPEGCDVHPFSFLWKAMRLLDNKVHWEELNRVIMKVNYVSEEDKAIDHIRLIRNQVGGRYTEKTAELLGEPTVSDGSETKRRITPWYTRAGFGGLLITPEDDKDGFRSLTEKYIPLIDDFLSKSIDIPNDVRTSKQKYLEYLTATTEITKDSITPDDELLLKRLELAITKYGKVKIICLSGIPGTGKSRLAKLLGSRLVSNDPYRYMEVQFHESTSYDDFVEGFVPRKSGEGFELVRKSLRVINRRAKLDPSGLPYVLVIEEFTRCNVHAVLGELITYIEHRDRPFRLALSQEEETIAPNLVIVATMNPRDKSAVILDDAIRRRLHIINIPSSTEALRSMLDGKLEVENLAKLSDWFERFSSILPFGHGIFADVQSEDDLREVWDASVRYYITDLSGSVKEAYKRVEEEYPWKS